MTDAITIRGLAKSYGSTAALRDLTFAVPEGSIYGLIGVNGAGKTITLSILVGLLAPSSGSVSILGTAVCIGARELVYDIGFYSVQYPFFDYLSGREMLTFVGRMH